MVEALELFANDVNVITYEFENVPAAAATGAGREPPGASPTAQILETTQDRLAEKDFVTQARHRHRRLCARRHLGRHRCATAIEPHRPAGGDRRPAASVMTARARRSSARATTTRRSGTSLGTKPAILEAFVPFEREISAIAARSAIRRGRVLRRHRERAPRPHPEDIPQRRRRSRTRACRARRAASRARSREALDYVGVLAVEMFGVLANGTGPTVLVNEIAPRVRNSWSLDARRRLGLAVRAAHPRHRRLAARQAGAPRRGRHHDQPDRRRYQLSYERWLTVLGATVHLYGKGTPRSGRKMGHATEVTPPRKQ